MHPNPNSSRSSEAELASGEEEQPSIGAKILHRLRQPETTSDMLLAIKGVIAGTAAWALSVFVLESDVAFMAPWTALLTVHATVHRSLSRGVQTVVSSAVGMGLAFVILQFFDVNIWSFALALLVGLVGARLSWIRDEGVAIATTAIFILTSSEPMFADRILELLVGVGVGIAVNMLIIPPLQNQQASRYVDSINRRIGAVLVEMADEFSESWTTDSADEWLKDTESMSKELNSAWQTVRFARESERKNPRKLLLRRGKKMHEDVSYEEILTRVDEGISHLRNLTRTLREAAYTSGGWDERFRTGWVSVARDTGLAVADPDESVEPLYDRLRKLTSDMSEAENLPNIEWPTYGALIASLRHIIIIVDDVASARETRQTD